MDYGFGKMLAFGAVTAALGGILAYKHRKEIERAVDEITDQLDANCTFSGDHVVHTVENPEEGEPDSDFVEFVAEEEEEACEDDYADHPEE